MVGSVINVKSNGCDQKESILLTIPYQAKENVANTPSGSQIMLHSPTLSETFIILEYINGLAPGFEIWHGRAAWNRTGSLSHLTD